MLGMDAHTIISTFSVKPKLKSQNVYIKLEECRTLRGQSLTKLIVQL